MNSKIKCVERIHNGFTEWKRANEEMSKKVPHVVGEPWLEQQFGHTQWLFSSEKGEISMIHVRAILLSGSRDWKGQDPFCFEIHCQRGDLFEDVIRFRTRKEALRAVEHYLV
jgi:hypothetical protein